jgi:hypothetical protein
MVAGNRAQVELSVSADALQKGLGPTFGHVLHGVRRRLGAAAMPPAPRLSLPDDQFLVSGAQKLTPDCETRKALFQKCVP